MVKGDLIMNNTDGQIKTRSRAKQSMLPDPISLPTTDAVLDRLYEEYMQEELEANKPARKSDPDQYTIVPASLKIVKVLIEELLSASGARAAANAASAAIASADFEDEEDGEEGWEDDDDLLDLNLAATKADFMSFAEGQRQRDDETQAYLTEFFIRAARENVANFQDWYNMLTEDEKSKLNELANASGQ